MHEEESIAGSGGVFLPDKDSEVVGVELLPDLGVHGVAERRVERTADVPEETQVLPRLLEHGLDSDRITWHRKLNATNVRREHILPY